MNKLPVIILFSMSLFIFGCSTNISRDYKFSEELHRGLAVGSITYQGHSPDCQAMYVIGVTNTKTEEQFALTSGSVFSAPGKEMGASGRVFAVDLPVGEYTVSKWNIKNGAYFLSSPITDLLSFSIKYKAATYIGAFHFLETEWDWTYCPAEKAIVTYEGKPERDLPLLKQEYKLMNNIVIHLQYSKNIKIDITGNGGDIRRPVILPLGF
ncbi:MAG: hypothetical protein OEW99_01295 [Gammaproteobacteria bacterium]|nr:hypothetical protein [Gammaproteobacteria bacterium]